MTYRPTEFEVENHTGIPLEIRLDRESPIDEGGTVWFEITQDGLGIAVTLHALEMLVDAANELLTGWREKPRTVEASPEHADESPPSNLESSNE